MIVEYYYEVTYRQSIYNNSKWIMPALATHIRTSITVLTLSVIQIANVLLRLHFQEKPQSESLFLWFCINIGEKHFRIIFYFVDNLFKIYNMLSMWMNKLASLAIRTVSLTLEFWTMFGLVFVWKRLFLSQLLLPMSETTLHTSKGTN